MANASIIKQAIEEAQRSRFERARLGAVLSRRSKVLGVGHNAIRHQSVLKVRHWPSSLHAEVAAMVDALKHNSLSDLRSSTLTVVRVNRQGELMMAKPCDDCFEVINNLGIVKKVVFSDEYGLLSEMNLH